MNISSLAAAESIDPIVKQMALVVPDFSIGDSLRIACGQNVAWSLPGVLPDDSRGLLNYYAYFFPDVPNDASALWARLSKLTTFLEWSDFATAVVCVTLGNLDKTHRLFWKRNALDISRAETDVTKFNNQLGALLSNAYTTAFIEGWPEFNSLLQKIDHEKAKKQYCTLLIDQVDIHELWYSEGVWKHPDWELFHHFIKLLSIGATTQEINQLIITLQAKGLTIPETITAGNWTSYTPYFQGKPCVTSDDIANIGQLLCTYPSYVDQQGNEGPQLSVGNAFIGPPDTLPGLSPDMAAPGQKYRINPPRSTG